MSLRLPRTLLHATIACAAAGLLGLHLSALPTPSAAKHNRRAAAMRRLESRRFLAERSIATRGAAAKRMTARAAHAALRAQQLAARGTAAAVLLGQPWQPLGPAQVSTSAYGLVTGRVSSIAADPSDATGNTVYLGTTGGGVWKSTNAAGSPGSTAFLPLTDDLPAFTGGNLASLSIGAISVQPGGTGVVLAGTGDPNDALDSYYGSGLLRSADSGLTWTLTVASKDLAINSVTDFHFVGEAFAGFAWSTASPDFVVAAVSRSAEGELVAADVIDGQGNTLRDVAGLYYSTDAGQSWLLATITDGPNQVIQSTSVSFGGGGNAATSVVWNPLRKRFYAAVRFHGYYESLDGITFTRLLNQPGPALTTIECPANPNSLGSPACPIFRGSLAVQPVTGDMFALTVDAYNLDQGLWQDACAVNSGACASAIVAFGLQLPSAAFEDGAGGISEGDYSLSLAAVPRDSDTLLFVGTGDIFRCRLSESCVWRNATNNETCAAAGVAPSQHAFDSTFAASLGLMYFGNDSGLWRSTDNVDQTQPPCSSDDARHFQNLNGGLGSLAEVQAFVQDAANSSILLAGLGVNGTAASIAAAQTLWPQVLDGYGSFVAIDPARPQNWYAQGAGGVAIYLCANGAACDAAGFSTQVVGYPQIGTDAFASLQPSPFLLDPKGTSNLIAGACHVWLGPADGLAWSAANDLGDLYPGEGPDCDGNALMQSLAATGVVSTPDGNTELIYAGAQGIGFDGPRANSGHLFQAAISDAAPVPAGWTDLWLSPVANSMLGFNPEDFTISSVTADPHDATGNTVYATIQGFNSATYPTAMVYASTNGGATWLNISSNLPVAPANSLVIDPNDANTVYLALDTGVYSTTAVTTCTTQNCWSVYGTGLPNSPIIQLASFNSGGNALLRAATYGRGIWQIPLITAAATATTLAVSPASLTFAPQVIQTLSTAQTLTVTNTGTIPLVVKSVAIDGDFAEVSACGPSVAVGGTCQIRVTFTPTAIGTRTATLTVYANIAGGQATVALTGTGIHGGAIVLLPTSVNFGSSAIGVATTPARYVTISNTGGVPVNLTVPIATGDFAIVANTCSANLAPNFGCTVGLIFTPTASGQRSGIFTIADAEGAVTASLAGIGVAPATDSISPKALTFAPTVVGGASAAQAVTLTNSGDSPLKLIAIQVSGDFLAVNGCGNSLIGHASCSIKVSYVPRQVGGESGILTVNDIYGRPQAVTLNGSGIAPAGVSALPSSVSFGPWGIAGTSPPRSVTITNSGGLTLNGLKFAITGPFAISGTTCAFTVAVGASCTVEVVFSPKNPGPQTGNLTIFSSSIPKPFEIALDGGGLGFTFQAAGSSSATVSTGQTASYQLQIVPDAGSTGPIALTCGSAPQNSTCTVNPASIQISSGVTASVSVTVAIPAASSEVKPAAESALLAVVVFPVGLCLMPFSIVPWRRSRLVFLSMLLAFSTVLIGCGVTAGAGGSTTPTGKPTPVPSATYNPVVTATGPGIVKNVKLILIVD